MDSKLLLSTVERTNRDASGIGVFMAMINAGCSTWPCKGIFIANNKLLVTVNTPLAKKGKIQFGLEIMYIFYHYCCCSNFCRLFL